MEALTCKNCGSTEFTKLGDKFVCDYCRTEYFADEKGPVQKVALTPAAAPKKKKSHLIRNTVFIMLILLGLTRLIPGTANKSTDTNSSKAGNYGSVDASDSDRIKYGLAHITDLKGWTAKAYQSIQVATENHSSVTTGSSEQVTIGESTMNFPGTKEVVTYTGGTKFADLVKEVGRPNSTDSYSDSYNGTTTVTAEWETDYNSGSNSVTIDINYDQASGQITEKNIDGYKNN